MPSKRSPDTDPHGQNIDDLIGRMMRNVGTDVDIDHDGQDMRKYVLQLPLWSDKVRGSPNEVLRSALFKPTNRNIQRKFLKDEAIAVIGEGNIRYTGEELRQDDEPVWLQLLHLYRGKPIGSHVEFAPAAFLREVRRCHGRNPSIRDYKWLSDTITRFTATALVVQSARLKTKVGLSMVRRFVFQDEDGKRLARWRVWMEPEITLLFGGFYYTQIEWEIRLALRSGLATWLMGFLSSHRKPYPVKIETLMSTISRYDLSSERAVRDFRRDICNALNELVKIGFISSYSIDNTGLIKVDRAA